MNSENLLIHDFQLQNELLGLHHGLNYIMSEFQEIASVLKISKIFQNHMWSYIWKPQEKPKVRPNNFFLDFEN